VRCGRYEGSGSRNTPLAIGTRVYRLDVVCGGEGGGQNNLTQIIYAAQSTFGTNRVFYRLRDNSVWYPWREVVFKTDLPTAGTTQALPSGAIGAGTCTNLTAVINNASRLRLRRTRQLNWFKACIGTQNNGRRTVPDLPHPEVHTPNIPPTSLVEAVSTFPFADCLTR
jgi:hypothetical protein